MALTTQQEKKIAVALFAVFAALVLYRMFSVEEKKTAPLTFTQGMKLSSPVRRGLAAPGGASDPLLVFLERRIEKYPGVGRDLFRMGGTNGQAKQRPMLITRPVATVTRPTSTIPSRTPEETAQDMARADLSTFRFLGYLTDKDSSLFLSKDGELFIVKSGDTILKNYQVKAVGKDNVVLFDTITKVEVRIELTGSAK
ncbi:MAG: hypothetical protein AABZ15_13140 [Nitrospirota bacterium]